MTYVMTDKNGNCKALDNWKVPVVYIASGKAIAHNCGSYVNGNRCTTCRQIIKINNNGIHHVPVIQKNKVKPFKNGVISINNDNCSACKINVEPANVVIATAPMLIQ